MFPLDKGPSWALLDFERTMAAVNAFLGSESIVALSVAEVNPGHDPDLKMTKVLIDHIIEGLKPKLIIFVELSLAYSCVAQTNFSVCNN